MSLAGIRALQASNSLMEAAPPHDCQWKESILIEVSRSMDLLKGHRMAVSTDSATILHINWEMGRYDSMPNNLVKETEASICLPLIQCSPSKLV